MTRSPLNWLASKAGRSLTVATAIPACLMALAKLIQLAPFSQDLRETLGLAVLLPIRLFARFTEWAVNCIGPSDRSEPASHYLPQWAVHLLVVLSVVLFVATLFSIFFAAFSWIEQAKSRHAQRP